MEGEALKAPGLIWKPRANARIPVWRASRAAVAAGYPVRSVNLASIADAPLQLVARCHRLQAEMNEWVSGRRSGKVTFDGTFLTLIDHYLTDPDSKYRKLKASSQHPYDIYAAKLKAMIGARRIDACDGRDVMKWFATWSEPGADGKPKLAAARMALTVIKASISFGIVCRLPGCKAFKAILQELEFEAPKPRSHAPSAEQVIAARKAAHAIGYPSAALAYALQFEGPLRQYDVIGYWVPLSDPLPSAIIVGDEKWIGPTWASIDENLIFGYTLSKTENTTAVRVRIDLRLCPMVLEELSHVPVESRTGPLIKHPQTGLPFTQWNFRDLWRRNADAAGIPKYIWNRDLRAGGNTEAQDAGTRREDRSTVMGHTKERTTADVYDRGKLEAHRRLARARIAHRKDKDEG